MNRNLAISSRIGLGMAFVIMLTITTAFYDYAGLALTWVNWSIAIVACEYAYRRNNSGAVLVLRNVDISIIILCVPPILAPLMTVTVESRPHPHPRSQRLPEHIPARNTSAIPTPLEDPQHPAAAPPKSTETPKDNVP